jgi:acetyl-CoA synthetase
MALEVDLPPMVRQSTLVPPVLAPSGRHGMRTVADVERVIAEALADPGAYWASVGDRLEWMGGWRPDPIVTGSLADGFAWFPGATGNVSVNCVDRHARRDPSRVAVHWIGEDGTTRTWTYGELLDQTARFARALTDLGVGAGDVVAIYLPNLLEAFAAVHACFRIGAVYNIVFSGFSAQALADRVEDTGAKVVVTCDQTFRRGRTIELKVTVDSVLDRLPSVEHVVVVRRGGRPTPMTPGRDHYYDDLLAATPAGAEPIPVEANEPGFLIYTSGTTAKPKGLVHSGMGFLVGAMRNVELALDLGPEDVYWCTADVGWLTFPIFELVGATALGATMLAVEGALDHPAPDRAFELIERFRVTKLFTAPTAVRMWARAGADWVRAHDLSQLQLVSLVGEPLDAATWHWLEDQVGHGHLEINNTYGQSETGSAWTSSVVGVTPAKPGSCGIATPGHRFAIVDDDGRPVPTGQVGYLVLTSSFPALFRGVWRDPERYRNQYFSRFGPGRYDSADAALVDPDGHLWVVGRVDGVINVAAHRLSTMEMESALLDVPGVAEAAVVGVPDPEKGQVPVAFVTETAEAAGQLDPAALAGRLAEAIGPIARPRAVFVLPALPRTRSGKIVRRLLRELVVDGSATGDTSGLENPEVLGTLAPLLRPGGQPEP